jgi:drug/metabolite transporter (DMT)-like permease
VNPKTTLLILLSIVLGAGGQLLFKWAARSLPPFSDLGLLRLLQLMFTTPAILGGFVCFFISALLWIVAIRSVPLNIAYPMVALSYVIIFVGSHLLFNEPLGWRHWAGAVLIIGGILLIAWRN